jgi:hypothetical protein
LTSDLLELLDELVGITAAEPHPMGRRMTVELGGVATRQLLVRVFSSKRVASVLASQVRQDLVDGRVQEHNEVKEVLVAC